MENIWKQALKDYKAEFGNDFDATWSPQTDDDLADKLRAEKINFESWRARHAKLWKALAATTMTITRLGKIASEISQSAFPPAAAATTGLVALVSASQHVTEAYDGLEQLFTKLEDVLSRWNVGLRRDVDDKQKQKMQQILVLILSIVFRSRKLMKQGRTRRLLASFAFGKDQKIADALESLEELVVSEDRMRMTLSLDKVNALWDKAVHSEGLQLLQKLESPAVQMNNQSYHYRLEDKLVGTGKWFKEDPLFKLWMVHHIPYLLLFGGPGSGKSYLATSLIDDLTQSRLRADKASAGLSVAYFYYNRGCDLATMLKTMAHQIQIFNHEYRQHVIETLDQGDLYTAKETWTKLFLEYWDKRTTPNERLMLIIDGLGEASPEETETFAKEMIRDPMKGGFYNIQLALFDQNRLWSDFDFVPRERTIEIDEKKNREDIMAYIDREMPKIVAYRKRSDAEKAEFKKQVSECCHGIFEWARLLLAKCKEKGRLQIRKLLQNPPESLEDMIKSCFDQIMADEAIDPDMLKMLLTCLTYEKRPLRLGEIYNFIWVATGEHYELFWRNIVRSLSSIIRWRSSRSRQWEVIISNDDNEQIETLEDEDSGWSQQVRETWIFFGNSKIREYVVSQSKAGKADEDRWPPSETQSECDMVKACLKTLRMLRLQDEKKRWLSYYALRFMPSHLRAIDIKQAKPEDQVEIAKELIWLFYDEAGQGILALDGGNIETAGKRSFWNMWMENDRNVIAVQAWLNLVGSMDEIELDDATRDWTQLAAKSKKELFKPFASFLRRRWLCESWSPKPLEDLTDWATDVTLALSFLPAYDGMDENETYPAHCREYFTVYGLSNQEEEIMATAQFGQPEQDPSFHLGVAVGLISAGLSHAVEGLPSKIPEDHDSYWAACWLQARACANRHEAEQALSWANIAHKLNPLIAVNVDLNSIQWFLQKHELNKATDLACKLYDTAVRQYDDKATGDVTIRNAAMMYLKCVRTQGDFGTTIKIARVLHQKMGRSDPYSILNSLLVAQSGTCWEALGQAYMMSQSPEDRNFILDVVQGGLPVISQSEGEWLQIWYITHLAEFNRCYVVDGHKRSIQQYLGNITRIKETTLIVDPVAVNNLLIETRQSFAFFLYQLAQQQEADCDVELDSTVKLLQSVSEAAQENIRQHPSQTMDLKQHLPCFYYGRWLRDHAPVEEEMWRSLFREPLLKCIGMLDDSTPHNDFLGIIYSYRILATAGDATNALAILGIVLMRIEIVVKKEQTNTTNIKSKDVTEAAQSFLTTQPGFGETSDNSEATQTVGSVFSEGAASAPLQNMKDDGQTIPQDPNEQQHGLSIDRDIPFACDVCSALSHEVDAMYQCDDCFELHYCARCVPKDPIHPVFGRRCGSRHRLTRVVPMADDLKNIAAVRKGNEIYLKGAWLDKIKKEWAKPEKD